MNICLFGATGRVGRIILENAVQSGHQIRALVRDSNKIEKKSPSIDYIVGDVLNEMDVMETMKGCIVVISALNTEGADTLSKSTPIIMKQMELHGVKRIITIGTAGILQARTEPHLYRFQSSESKRKSTKAAEDHLQSYLALKNSTLDWTIVCPTYLPDGERIGIYRYEIDMLPVNSHSISIYDTADFAFQQIQADEFFRCRVGLSY